MLTQFTHTRLLVSAEKFAESYRFYRDIVGLTPRFDGEKSVYAEFEAGDPMTSGAHALALFREDLMSQALGNAVAQPARPVDRLVICLGVENVDQTAAELAGKGVQLVTQPHDQPAWMIRVAHFRDPAGNLVEISAPLRVA